MALGGCAASAPVVDSLQLVREWVRGAYDNRRQAEADAADARLPDELKHRLMHQLFVPVDVPVPAIPGYLVFQQSSIDGSEDPDLVTRVGLLQFTVDPDGTLRQRELNFRDPDRYKNGHRRPEALRALTLDEVRFDPACDFTLRPNVAGDQLAGPMQAGACRIFSAGLGKTIVADDAVVIRRDEYWFLGRFVDEDGRVVFGNASAEPVRLIRRQ
jgi:hypothetical protein